MAESKAPKRHSRIRIWLPAASLVILILAALAAWSAYTWHRLNHAPLPKAAVGQVFIIDQGESLSDVARSLAARGVIEHAWDLELLARLGGDAEHIQAGEYRVESGMALADLLGAMVSGDVVMHGFTIIPGETFAEMFSRLEADPVFEHNLKGLSPAEVMARLGHPHQQAEGMFFPETYAFARGTSDVAVLKRAYHSMQRHLKKAWRNRAPNLVLDTPYAALIVASIVEKETAVASERARIAGVFERRLKKGMLLAADPTVIYGLGSRYHGDLTFENMAIDTPYNTYLHRGLPPTPICLPGMASLRAALHPAHGSALYFVARGDGTHVFSDTLAEQKRMIRKYQLHGRNAPDDGKD